MRTNTKLNPQSHSEMNTFRRLGLSGRRITSRLGPEGWLLSIDVAIALGVALNQAGTFMCDAFGVIRPSY